MGNFLIYFFGWKIGWTLINALLQWNSILFVIKTLFTIDRFLFICFLYFFLHITETATLQGWWVIFGNLTIAWITFWSLGVCGLVLRWVQPVHRKGKQRHSHPCFIAGRKVRAGHYRQGRLEGLVIIGRGA